MSNDTHSSISTMREATALQQFRPVEQEIHPVVDTLHGDGPINAALLANLEKKERSPFSISKEALQPIQPSAPPHVPPYPPLALVTKPNLTTAEAAYYLNRRPQTLRGWASLENFPDGLRCNRIGGLLAWSTAQVKALTGVA